MSNEETNTAIRLGSAVLSVGLISLSFYAGGFVSSLAIFFGVGLTMLLKSLAICTIVVVLSQYAKSQPGIDKDTKPWITLLSDVAICSAINMTLISLIAFISPLLAYSIAAIEIPLLFERKQNAHSLGY